MMSKQTIQIYLKTMLHRQKITDELNQIFTQQELKQAIKKLKRNSATGDDKITYEFFHYIPPAGLERLLELYNTI